MPKEYNFFDSKTANFEHVKYCKKNILQYSLGGLMYSPATNETIADSLINKKYPSVRSVAFCLEDAIEDSAVEKAEEQLCLSFEKIQNAIKEQKISVSELPIIFIRVRNPEMIERVYKKTEDYGFLTGFILPKFDTSNAADYIREMENINANSNSPVYFMPILESKEILSISTRLKVLEEIKKELDSVNDIVLNVRIGGNDFCNVYGFRRNSSQTIYDIAVIRNVIADIVNIFGSDYVVSAPVWEYFGNEKNFDWYSGLINELELDKLNGLIGKTAVHPTQVPVINESLKVSKNDYSDALNILNWSDSVLAVSKSVGGDRMNEQKVHEKWAEKIIALSSIYGVK